MQIKRQCHNDGLTGWLMTNLHSLYFKPVHEVYNYNGEITKCRTPRPQVGKGGMPAEQRTQA
eukprot:3398422-Amphidinium_carterae.1